MTAVGSAEPAGASKRVLDPAERIAEVLFGLIMVLTFTGSLSIAEAGKDDVRAMLIGALGCNVAWGIIDGVLYLMGSLADKGRSLATYVGIRRAATREQAHALIADSLPPLIAASLQPDELERLRLRLLALPEPPARARLGAADWRGAAGIFLLVFFSTLPVAVPFLMMKDTASAIRASNAVAVVMLFACGIGYARVVGRSPWVLGAAMVALGAGLVALTMALGG
jgi:VIT1/CCC1 family predicted Fe2+/Mn2+ transporter